MNKIKLVLSLLLLSFLGCSKGYELEEAVGYAKNAAYDESVDNYNSNSSATVERKIIKEGHITYKTDDLGESKNDIVTLVNSLNGYISSDREYKSTNQVTNNLTVRIPSDKFEEFFAKLSEKAEYIDEKSINLTDVTEEFLDVEVRLRNKKALENRFIEILKEANSVSEILEVEREIGKIREEIESTEGRLNYLKNETSLSTVYVTIYQELETVYRENPVIKSLKNGWKYLLSFLLLLLNIWPFIIIIGLSVWGFIKLRQGREAKG